MSTQNFPEVAEHLTTGTMLTLFAPGEGRTFARDGERPFGELWAAAMAADAELNQRGTSTS